MRAIVVSRVRLGLVAVGFLLVTPGASNAQKCTYLRKPHADGTCALPTIDNDCGCCNFPQHIEP